MAQYDMFQMSQMLGGGNNISPRNEVYEKEFNDINHRLNNTERNASNIKSMLEFNMNQIEDRINNLHEYMFATDYLRRLFPHFPKIPFKVDEIPCSSHFTMIVHDGTGEDFCALYMRPCKYDEEDEDKYFSHIDLMFAKSEYIRFIHFMAAPEVAESFSTWHCYVFRREVETIPNEEAVTSRYVRDILEDTIDLVRFKPIDGIPYDFNMSDCGLNVGMTDLKIAIKHFPKLYTTEELSRMTDRELDHYINHNIKSYNERHLLDYQYWRMNYHILLAPYSSPVDDANRRSCTVSSSETECKIFG